MATLEQIAEGIRRAHAAGDTENVRKLGAAYRAMQGQQNPAQPVYDAGTANLPVPGNMTPDPQQPERYRSMIPGGDAVNEFAASFAENIPIVGPLATRAADATGAQIAAIITGQAPDAMAEQAQELRARDASESPIAGVAGAVAGSVGPLMSLGTTKFGEQALGLTGPLWRRVVAGGLSGAGIAAGDAVARGESTNSEILGQAGLGLGLGAGMPLAERAISPIARMLFGQNVPKAVQNVGRNLEREGIDPAALMARINEIGPDAVLADLGPNFQRQAGAIASLPGEGQAILREALVRRQQGANARIQGDVDAALGPAPVPSQLQATIREGQQALSPEYQQALRGASPVDTTDVAATLDDVIRNRVGPEQRAAQQVRAMLDEFENPGVLSADPARLLSARQAIDGLLGDATNNQVIGVLSAARRDIDELLAQNVPGIKQVDARFAELARQNEAVDAGQQVLDSGRTAPRPAEVEGLMTQGVQPDGLLIGPSGAAFRLTQGARAEVDRIIGTSGNNLTALKSALKGDGSWNRDRLATLYGQDKADRLLGILEREQRYAQTFDTVTRNSETAARTAAQKEAAPQQFGQASTSLTDLLLKIPQGLANMGARSRSEATNRAIADLLIGRPTPEMVDQLLAARQMNRGLVGSSGVPLLTNQ